MRLFCCGFIISYLIISQARKSIRPEDMFKPPHCDLYSQYDSDGVPTHDAAGEKLSKSGLKKLRKDWEKQKKLFETGK